MSNAKEHRIVGRAAGAAYAMYRSRDEELVNMIVETLGGLLGGEAGSRLPDLLEPAVHGWHRNHFHSWSAVGGLSWATSKLINWETHCRAEAARCRRARDSEAATRWTRVIELIAELLWRLAAGVVAGLVAGYLSHLALDAGTPRGLPLLGR